VPITNCKVNPCQHPTKFIVKKRLSNIENLKGAHAKNSRGRMFGRESLGLWGKEDIITFGCLMREKAPYLLRALLRQPGAQILGTQSHYTVARRGFNGDTSLAGALLCKLIFCWTSPGNSTHPQFYQLWKLDFGE
jgi:hypothetical protein